MTTDPSFLRPPEHSVRWWAFEVAIAALTVAASVPSVLQNDRSNASHISLAVSVALIAAMCVPLIFRRIAPTTVFLLVTAVTIGAAINGPGLIVSPAVLVAVYTVAAEQSRRRALAAATTLAVGLILSSGHDSEATYWDRGLFFIGLVLAALGLGLYTSTRRAYIAALVENAARLERERDQQGDLAAAAERARIAREMHDIVAHHLTVIVSLSQGATAAIAAAPDAAADAIREITTTGRQALRDTRNLLGVLREDGPECDDDRQFSDDALRPAPTLSDIDSLITRVRAAGLSVSYEIHGAKVPMRSGAELTIYRVIQEALTNVLKHGGRDAAAIVRIQYSPSNIHCEIQSRGPTLTEPVENTAGPGRGLIGMKERMQAQGGTLDAGPDEHSGWLVSASIPSEGNA